MPCKGIQRRCPPKGVSGTADCSVLIMQSLCKGTPLCGNPKHSVARGTPGFAVRIFAFSVSGLYRPLAGRRQRPVVDNYPGQTPTVLLRKK